jgi:pimeloyl-ACP methyl ester carboxylesterase
VHSFPQMLSTAAGVPAAVTAPAPPQAPITIEGRFAEVNGTKLHYLIAGKGDPVLLLHGYAQTSHMWRPLIAELAKTHTVIAPDLRGFGESAKPDAGYDKKTMAQDVHALAASLGYRRVAVVGHDIGLMVAYAYAAQHPADVERIALMDAFLPGVGDWKSVWLLRDLWHFHFYGKTPLALVEGRERVYFEHFWNDFAADPTHSVSEADRRFYATAYAQPGGMRAGFEAFRAFEQDAKDFAAFAMTKLTMPMLVLSGEKAGGQFLIDQGRLVDDNVEGVIVKGAGHWLMDEAPDEVIAKLVAFATAPLAAVAAMPSKLAFRTLEVETNDASIYVRVGGKGPAVVMLHGFGETGDMWAPLAAALAGNHTIVIPDLRGMGLSSHPPRGYGKKTQAGDIARVLDVLAIDKSDLVTHDIGIMVGYAFAALNPARVTRFVAMDAFVPGVGAWDEIIRIPRLWHFNFRGPDVERLVAGRERIYLDRFWNELSADPSSIDEATREHYARLYGVPGAMHSAFEQFAALAQDAIDNKALAAKGKLKMPVLGIGGEKAYGSRVAEDLRFVADNVTGAVIANSGHWIMNEQPAAAIDVIRTFLDKP